MLLGVALALFGVAPMVIGLSIGSLAERAGCEVNPVHIPPCRLLGVDWAWLLDIAGVLPLLIFYTMWFVPVGAAVIVIDGAAWLVALVQRRSAASER